MEPIARSALKLRWVAILLMLGACSSCSDSGHDRAFSGSHGASPEPSLAHLFPTAEVTKENVDDAIGFENELAKRYDVPAPAGEAWFRILDGASHVMITAPHATAQTRQGSIKQADGGTGSLAYMLNKLAGCPVIYTTYRSPSDPNFYDDNAFKTAVSAMLVKYKPTLVLDIHASHWSRPYDVDFGTMGGASLLGNPRNLFQLAASLRNEGLDNFSQDYFAASANQTDTKWISRQGVPCIQCEFSGVWLLPFGPSDQNVVQVHRFAQLLQGLIRFVGSEDRITNSQSIH